MSNAHIVYVWIEIIFLHLAFCVFFFMHAFQILGDKMHCLYTVHKTHNYFIQKKILKISLMVLFIYLKIILL